MDPFKLSLDISMLLREEKRRNELILVNVVKGGRRSEFQIVDLEAGKFLCNHYCIQSLITEFDGGNIIRSGRQIFYIGYKPFSPSSAAEADVDSQILSGDIQFLQTGVSCLELSNNLFEKKDDDDDDDDDSNKVEYKWADVPCFPSSRIMVGCASLSGILYALGRSMNPAPENYCNLGDAFNPSRGVWQELPYASVVHTRTCVSPKVISDERRRRLIVHLESSDSLYTYFPDEHLWCCIAIKFKYWSDVSALVDDILYFYHSGGSSPLRAYDVISGSWLKVVVPSSSELHWPINFSEFEFDDMFHLGNDMLCLATSYMMVDPLRVNKSFRELLFVKFQVKRTSPGEVTVTPGPSKTFSLDGHWPVRGFIPL